MRPFASFILVAATLLSVSPPASAGTLTGSARATDGTALPRFDLRARRSRGRRAPAGHWPRRRLSTRAWCPRASIASRRRRPGSRLLRRHVRRSARARTPCASTWCSPERHCRAGGGRRDPRRRSGFDARRSVSIVDGGDIAARHPQTLLHLLTDAPGVAVARDRAARQPGLRPSSAAASALRARAGGRRAGEPARRRLRLRRPLPLELVAHRGGARCREQPLRHATRWPASSTS